MRAERATSLNEHARRAALYVCRPDAGQLRRTIVDPQLSQAGVSRNGKCNGDRCQRLDTARCRERGALRGSGVGQQIAWRSLLPAIGQGHTVDAGRLARALLQAHAREHLRHTTIQPDRGAEWRSQATRAVILLPVAQKLTFQLVAGCGRARGLCSNNCRREIGQHAQKQRQ